MKVRVLGTKTDKYFKNFISIPENVTSLSLVNIGETYCILEKGTENIYLKFYSNVTRKQNIECWKIHGWIEEITIKEIKITNKRTLIELLNLSKESLLNNYVDKSLEALANMKLLALESKTRAFSNNDLLEMGVSQLSGTLSVEKLKKEIGRYEKELLKDTKWMIKVRKVLYEKIFNAQF